MNDVDLIYFMNIIQLSCHMEKVNWATWINLRLQIWTIEIINFIKNIFYLLFNFKFSKCTICATWQ